MAFTWVLDDAVVIPNPAPGSNEGSRVPLGRMRARPLRITPLYREKVPPNMLVPSACGAMQEIGPSAPLPVLKDMSCEPSGNKRQVAFCLTTCSPEYQLNSPTAMIRPSGRTARSRILPDPYSFAKPILKSSSLVPSGWRRKIPLKATPLYRPEPLAHRRSPFAWSRSAEIDSELPQATPVPVLNPSSSDPFAWSCTSPFAVLTWNWV